MMKESIQPKQRRCKMDKFFELKRAVDWYMWTEGESTVYTLDHINALANELAAVETDEKKLKEIRSLQKRVNRYEKPMSDLESECRRGSDATRNTYACQFDYTN